MFFWLLWRKEFFILYFYPLNIQEVFLLLFFLSILCILIKTADVLIEAQLLFYFIMQGNLITHPDLHHCLLSCSVLFFILLPVTQTTVELWVMKFKYMKQQIYINFNMK